MGGLFFMERTHSHCHLLASYTAYKIVLLPEACSLYKISYPGKNYSFAV
jgi:hypothetical protein